MKFVVRFTKILSIFPTCKDEYRNELNMQPSGASKPQLQVESLELYRKLKQ